MRVFVLFVMAVLLPAAQELPEVERVEAGLVRVHEALAMLQVPPQPANPPQPPQAQHPAPTPVLAGDFFEFSHDAEGVYRAGKRSLEKRDWERAVRYFNRIVEGKMPRSDAALYWKAYALSRMGRMQDALSSLSDLTKLHAGSRWLNDARALEIEVKQSSGQPVSPDAEADEEMKLLALNGLMRSEPDRAFPALERILAGSASPGLKERALFVAARNRSPRTRDLLLKYARGGANPDLQARAVEYLGHQISPEALQTLEEIYAGSTDATLKRAVLRAYTAGRAKDKLFAAARSEKTPELKRDAVRGLGELDADAELWQLLQSESDSETRVGIIHALPRRSESSDRIIELARSEKDPKVRAMLFEQLGQTRTPKNLEALVSFYSSEKDADVRKRILRGIRRHESAKALVEIARMERDPKLKRAVVEELAGMKSKEATDYLMELLSK